jgi:hypothetical protein
LDASVNGAGRRLIALLLGVVLGAVGCTGERRDAGGAEATAARPGSPPATRSAADGITCLRDDERAVLRHFITAYLDR